MKRMFDPRSLKVQLLFRALLIVSALLLLIGVFQYLFMQQFLYRNKAESIRSQISALPLNALAKGGERPQREERGAPRFYMPELALAFIDEAGSYELVSANASDTSVPRLSREELLELAGRSKPGYRIMRAASGDEQIVVSLTMLSRGRIDGILQASASTGPVKEVLLRQLFTFLALSMLALIAALLTFLPVLRKTLIPLSNMVATVKRMDAGNLADRLPVNQGQVEIERLSVSFNGMLERLQRSFEAEKEAKERMSRFVADASHELRTPLTSIHGFLEVLLRGAAHQPEQLDKALRSMRGESARINKLVQDLLLLARLDRIPDVRLIEGNLDELLLEMEPHLRMLAGQRAVRVHTASELSCRFDSDKMKQVVLNLFHNAVQHTDAQHGKIELRLERAEGVVELAVADNGCGISAEHLVRVFDRFYRIDSSRTRKSGGAGLGLAITFSIVELHGGSIHAESSKGEGTTFRVLLPC